MALNQWFKFYGGEFLSDPKIASLSAQERSCWITMLSLSSMASEPGVIDYLTNDILLQKSGVTESNGRNESVTEPVTVLEKFTKMNMISVDSTGRIEVLNWKKRQETALTNAERQAKYRVNKESNEKVTEPVTKVTLDKIRLDKSIHIGEADASQVMEVHVSDDDAPLKRDNRVKDKLAIYNLFSSKEQPWWNHSQQRRAALTLFDLVGLEKVRAGVEFMKEHSDDKYCPQAGTPFKYEEQMPFLAGYVKRNDL